MDEDGDRQYDQGGYISGGPVPVFIHPGERFYSLDEVAREFGIDLDEDEDEA